MKYRVYFNRCPDFPQMWSVDEGTQDTEINVLGFRLTRGVTAESRSHRCEDKNVPTGWLEVNGTLHLEGGIAVFRPLPSTIETTYS